MRLSLASALVLLLSACPASRSVSGGVDDGGAPDDPLPTDAGDPGERGDGGDGSDADMPEPLTLRLTGPELTPLDGTLTVASDDGTRRAVGDRITLTGEELAESAVIFARAEGFAAFGLTGFARDDYASLPTLDGDPVVALLPLVVTDPVGVEVRRDESDVVRRLHTVPLGYGGGFSTPSPLLQLQRDAAIEALILLDEGPCPRRLPIADLPAAPDPLIIELADERFEDVPCEPRLLEVRDPSGSRLREVTVSPAYEGVRPLVSGSEIENEGQELAGGRASTMGREPVPALEVEVLLPLEELPVRDHPAVRPRAGATVRGRFVLEDGREVFSSLTFPSWDAVPDAVVLPEPVVQPQPVAQGLSFDRDNPLNLAALPEALVLEVGPDDARWPVLFFGRGTVLAPPGTSTLRRRRVVETLVELPGEPLVTFETDDPGDGVPLFLTLIEVSFTPLPRGQTGELVFWQGDTRRVPLVLVPRVLLEK